MRAAATDTLLILGDSLSAGYRLPIAQAWPSLLDKKWQTTPSLPKVVNASISGDTAAQGLARLPALLKQHQPRWVLIELGANDALRGFPTQDIQRDLSEIINQITAAKAQPLLMQIRIPPTMAAVILMLSPLSIHNWRNSSTSPYSLFLWNRLPLSQSGCRMMVYTLTAMPNRLSRIGWRNNSSR